MYDSLDIYERLGSYIDTNCCLLTAECLEKILQSEKKLEESKNCQFS